ncbi:TetR/AcrR family transcriptional regulator [Congregibacter sp.]|uniref:TetR/AcrR family transcriptional regulator n=1 Tax=Congregibacter sp. TaxID=2744308 RepID=UPI003F6AD058
MKTRDRILVASLRLFNEEGEAHATTLDIAGELDISPGNLYYHFKGKDQIIAELFEQFQLALTQTLNAPVEQPLHEHKGRVEDNWYYLYVVLEELYLYRFFYHNLDDLMRRYPSLVRGFRRILTAKRAALKAIISSLFEQSETQLGKVQMDALVENMTLQLTYWLSYDRLLHDESDAQRCIHQGVLQLLTMIAPYLGEEQMDFYRECEMIFDGMMDASNQ